MTVDVVDGFIGDKGATACLTCQTLSIWARTIGAEVVDCEGLFPLIDKLDHLTDVFEGKHWHHRPKNFLLHQSRVQIWLQNDRWLDVAHLFVPNATADRGTTCSVDKFANAIIVEVIDHFTLKLGSIWFFLAVHGIEFFLDTFDKLLYLCLVHEDIVRRDTDLTRVDCLAKGHFDSCKFHRRVMIDDGRALATKL